MLTDIEKLSICTVMRWDNIPTQATSGSFMDFIKSGELDRDDYDRIIKLRDDIDIIIGLKKDTIKQLTEQRDDAREDYADLKRATEALVYKIKEPETTYHAANLPGGHASTAVAVVRPIKDTYEFKEVKALLNIL